MERKNEKQIIALKDLCAPVFVTNIYEHFISNPLQMIDLLLMAEILHHLGCMKPYK